MPNVGQIFVAVVVCILSAAWSPIANAQDDQARAIFAEGVTAFDRGEPEEALRLFLQSYELRRSQSVLYNIAMTERRLGRNADALSHLYEWLGADDGTHAERLTEAESVIGELAPRLATLRLVREPPELRASMNGEPIPMTSGGILVLTPGTYQLRFDAEGYAPDERELSLPAGSDETIRVTLESLDGAQAAEGTDVEDGGGLMFTWVAAGIAVAFAGLAVGSWFAGDAEHDSLQESCAPLCQDEQLSTLRTWDTLTTVGIVGASIASVGAVVLALVESGAFAGDSRETVSIGPTGVSYRRTF